MIRRGCIMVLVLLAGLRMPFLPVEICSAAEMTEARRPITTPVVAEKSGIWENARLFYETYGNDAIFRPLSDQDGEIGFATMAGQSGAGIRYHTIGWKMSFCDESGSVKQVLFFALEGNYIKVKDYRKVEDRHYNLYTLRLSALRSRLRPEVRAEMEQGHIHMLLDACLAVCRDEEPSGSMNDDGAAAGQVYTSYDSIMAAVNWSEESQRSLKGYFGKQIEGLFLQVRLDAGEGISSVTGQGTYCYGTEAMLTAEAGEGYRFWCWEGDIRGEDATRTLVVQKDMHGRARARRLTPPTIRMDNLYITSGILDGMPDWEDWLLQYGYAWDEEDGKVEMTFSEADWKEQLLQSLADSGTAAITLKAEDSDHMVTEKEVKINMVNTDIKRGAAIGRIRFISPRYFEDEDGRLIDPAAGGLMEDSIWGKDVSYRTMLRSIFR